MRTMINMKRNSAKEYGSVRNRGRTSTGLINKEKYHYKSDLKHRRCNINNCCNFFNLWDCSYVGEMSSLLFFYVKHCYQMNVSLISGVHKNKYIQVFLCLYDTQ